MSRKKMDEKEVDIRLKIIDRIINLMELGQSLIPTPYT